MASPSRLERRRSSATTLAPPHLLEREPSIDEDGVVVPTEIYHLETPSNSPDHEHGEEAIKLLPQAFEALAASSTVKLGLDSDEEHLFETLINTTEAYERGEITLDIDMEENENNQNDTATTTTTTYSSNPPLPQPLEIRVAGGWVRDKILGLPTHDVDVTIDQLMGVPFATLIQKYLETLPANHPAKCQKKTPKIAVIAARPEQSKHLETACMMLHGIDLDLCHLRAEEIYTGDSRIPTATMGTPFQDAQRRDFTLNSLFYNLRTQQVEDWTKRGMSDLRARRLVTPLNAEVTFEDDPLRVLRAIRFAVRYQLHLDAGLEKACQLRKIHKALQVKVSRERVGKELEGMLSGKGANPQLALKTIGRLKLAGCVFCFPTLGETLNKTMISIPPHGTLMGQPYQGEHDDLNHLRELAWEESQLLLDFIPSLYELAKTQFPPTSTVVDPRLFPLTVFLLPFRFLEYEEKKQGNTNAAGKAFAVTTFMFRESIKFKNKDVTGIATLMENVDSMAKFLTDLAEAQQQQLQSSSGSSEQAQDAFSMCRLEAGLVLRATKELWVTTLLLACLLKLREQQQQQSSYDTTDWLQLTASAYKTILELNLEECWKAKPLLNGKAVIDLLKLPRGPLISHYLEEQTKWMLLNPDGTMEQCVEHLVGMKRRWDAEEQQQQNGNGNCDGNGKIMNASDHYQPNGQPVLQHPRLK